MQPARRGGNRLALQLATEPCEILKVTRSNLDIGAQFANGIPGVACLEGENLATSGPNGRSQRSQTSGALPDGQTDPSALRPCRCLNRMIDIGRCRHWHPTEWLERRGLVTLDPIARYTTLTQCELSIEQMSAFKHVASS
jgi:hypothetical protein